jgi:hypothetical protein
MGIGLFTGGASISKGCEELAMILLEVADVCIRVRLEGLELA